MDETVKKKKVLFLLELSSNRKLSFYTFVSDRRRKFISNSCCVFVSSSAQFHSLVYLSLFDSQSCDKARKILYKRKKEDRKNFLS